MNNKTINTELAQELAHHLDAYADLLRQECKHQPDPELRDQQERTHASVIELRANLLRLDTVLVEASDLQEGDRVCFNDPHSNFTIEEIDYRAYGVRLYFNEGTASTTRRKDELVRIRRRNA